MKIKKINEEIEKTLDSVNSFERYEGNPFMFTRIEAKINNVNTNSFRYNYVKKFILQLQPVVIALILFLNIWTAATFFTDRTESISQRDIELNNLIEEYALSANTYNFSVLDDPNTFNHE